MSMEDNKDFYTEFGKLLVQKYSRLTPDQVSPHDAGYERAQALGRYLRASRLNSDMSIHEVASKARMSSAEVAALEQGLLHPDEIECTWLWLSSLAKVLNDDIEDYQLLLGLRSISKPPLSPSKQALVMSRSRSSLQAFSEQSKNGEESVPVASSALDHSTRRDGQSQSSLRERLLRYVRLAWERTIRAWRSFLRGQVTPVRLAVHIVLLLMAVATVILSRVDLPHWDIARVAPSQAEDIGILPEPAFDQLPVGGSPLQEGGVLLFAPVPFTEIPDRPRTGVITYTVQVDDTILGIAEKFNLNPTTIMWANEEYPKNPFVMEVGQIVAILPIDGVLHTVKEGDTIEKIAKLYKVTADKIVGYGPNQLASADAPLSAGQVIIVPDGDKTPSEEVLPSHELLPRPGLLLPLSGSAAPWRSNDFIRPAHGPITQRFYRGVHPGIDIGAPIESPVYAADKGVVIEAGWSSVGYGNHIYLRHPDGFITFYAHLSRIDVSSGDYVALGQQIGTVGSTGRSTGVHLHFEVSIGGRTYNPLTYFSE